MIQLLQKTKRELKHFFKGTVKIRKTVHCKATWYGNSYGGFYINPDIITKNSIVYSFGIGEDVSFDSAILEKHHCRVYGFDPTPKSIEWVGNQNISPNFKFNAYGIGAKSELKTFFLPENDSHVSGSVIHNDHTDTALKIEVPLKSFQDILKELNHQSIDVLKMDIEGSEYEVIPELLKSGVYIKQILIEFHHRFIKDGKRKTLDAIKLLNNYGYEVFGVSDSFEEISLIRKNIL